MPVARLALAGAAAAVVALSGCGQEEEANDNPGALRNDVPQVEPTVIRTPVRVDEAPLTAPLPGATGGPQLDSDTEEEGEAPQRNEDD